MSKSAQPIARTIGAELERRIIEGVYAQAGPLRQADLAAEFGVSHIPVREALATLAEKGLVRIVPNRGAVVVPLSAGQCTELAEMRCALEDLAIRNAVPALADAHLAAAREALGAGAAATGLSERAHWNWVFHRSLYAAARRPFLLEQLESLWRHADRYLQYAWARARYEARSDQEHAQILEACVAGDAALASRLTRRHIRSAARAVERLLAGQP